MPQWKLQMFEGRWGYSIVFIGLESTTNCCCQKKKKIYERNSMMLIWFFIEV